ncbi:MAG: hypothetical protein H6923_04470 [Alphaproteobacteria bacterium]|nr:hypothetical protein [Alphaproteobacteria bacterium]
MARERQSRSELGEEVVERPSWLYPAMLAGLTLVIALVILYFYFGPRPEDLVGDTPNASVATRPIDFVISGRRFLIPENYTQFPRDRKGGERSGVTLYALLPDFLPFTARTADEFSDNGPRSRVVNIQIEQSFSPLDEAARLERIYLQRVRDPNGAPGPAGLTAFEFADKSGRFANDDLFVGKTDSGLAVFMCVKESAVIDNPNCRRTLGIGGTITVRYHFKRSRLQDWREINLGVLNLIGDFMDAAKAKSSSEPLAPASHVGAS